MDTLLTIRQSGHGFAYPTPQGNRPTAENAGTEDRDKKVRKSAWDLMTTPTKHPFVVHRYQFCVCSSFLAATPCGLHPGSTIPWTVAHYRRLSPSIVQPWLEGVKLKRRRSKGFRTLVHREPPLPQIFHWVSCTQSVGKLRFRKPEPLPPYAGRILATQSGFSCPQVPSKLVPPDGLSEEALGYTKVIGAAYPDSEDCKRFLQFDPRKPFPSPNS